MTKSFNNANYIKQNISIVLQGALNKSNLINVAHYCAHWRNILPKSEIILSISSSDYLKFITINDGYREVDILLKKQSSNAYHNAVNVIKTYCDKIIYNENSKALPLPALKKSDLKKNNNINYLIESSYLGINAASKKFCLRIRNDAFFQNTNFINIYLENYSLPRQEESSVLEQRLLISWIFTVNPYNVERIPLHPSDWFQFGLTEDLIKLWDIPFYSYKDSIYFENSISPHANEKERQFRSHLAVEQYIALQTLDKKIPVLNIDYINDLTHRNLAIDALIDNFIICSSPRLQLKMPQQYQYYLFSPRKRLSCITGDAWKFMILNRDIPYQKILKNNVDKNIKNLSNRNFILEEFPSEEISEKHYQHKNLLWHKIFFYILYKILNSSQLDKFLYQPEEFFKDTNFPFVKKVGEFYLK